MKKIIILTGSSLRHTFFRQYMASSSDIDVINSYCEGEERSLRKQAEKDVLSDNTVRLQHLSAREGTEQDFFENFVDMIKDQSSPVFIPKGDINNKKYTDIIVNSNADLLVAYGCSIIKGPLLSAFAGRFINVHLGLSPYYRGSGTNYWPLVNKEPEYVGATFMHIDAGIDTGEIIHQIRAKYVWGDTPSQIGNRLILEMCKIYKSIIANFSKLKKMEQISIPNNVKIYKNRDYTEESVKRLYKIFNEGLVEDYLNDEVARCKKVPIIVNDSVIEDADK